MNDIEIARSIKKENITKVAEKFGIDEKYIDQYGKYNSTCYPLKSLNECIVFPPDKRR